MELLEIKGLDEFPNTLTVENIIEKNYYENGKDNINN